eukprot:g11214.t1 g11214   contig5:382941-386300(-)
MCELPSTEQAIRYLHAAAGFPPKTTWLKAIRAGNFVTWPGISAESVYKFFPESEETQKGHMDRQRKGVRSTKDKSTQETQLTPMQREHDVFIKVYTQRDVMYTDQTGRLPAISSKGNQYVMVLCEIDGNVILVEPMRSKADGEMQKAYLRLLARLKAAKIVPKKHVLDNECSEAMKALIKETCQLELVPPGTHRRNIAEKAIQTFKKHFIGILAGTADDFPLHLWDRLLPQAEMTLNLLRQANARPTVSAWAYLFGPHDYNRMPLAPMGCAVQIHDAPEQRRTWAPHSVDGWYIGTSDEHYRCHKIFIKATRTERITDTVFFKHKYLTNPTVTPEDAVVKAAQDLTKAVQGNLNLKGKANMEAIQKLSDMFSVAAMEHKFNNEQLQPAQRNKQVQCNDIPQVYDPQPAKLEYQREQRVPLIVESPMHSSHPRVQIQQPSPRVPRTNTPSQAIQKLIDAKPTIPRYDNGPARNTRSQTVTQAAPAYNTRAKVKARENAMSVVQVALLNAMKGATPKQLASRKLPLAALCEVAGSIIDDTTGEVLEYRHLIRNPKYQKEWNTSCANEIGRLAQGIGKRIDGTNTMFFINKQDIPNDRFKDITYAKFVCDYRPGKSEPNRTRLTMGGDRINYPGEVGTPTADLLLVKILFNSIISTHGARCMTADIKNFYLNTPMQRYEYLRIRLSDIPQEVITEYGLLNKVAADGYVYLEVRKGMYGLPQAGLLAQELLEKRLAEHGYFQSKIIPGLWKHVTRPVCFTLVVDDFCVKYIGKQHAEHLMGVLKQHYEITEDWKGEKYCGLTIDWDYNNKKVHLSMPGYVNKALKRFGHEHPPNRQDQPYPHTPPKYGAKVQYAEEVKDSPPLNKEEQRYIQQVTGTFLYLARAVDSTMLTPLSAIASEQAKPTQATMKKIKQFLDYAASQEEAVLTYQASDMILAAHSDASYHSEPKARSRAGGHFFLSSDGLYPHNNGAILNIAQIIKTVMSSAAEAELGALYINAREAVWIRRVLEEMGHTQTKTPMQTDNSTAEGVVNNKIQPKRTKAMDMRFYWLRDQEAKNQFRFYWAPGATNYADYWTKHHAAAHHKNMRSMFLTPRQQALCCEGVLKTTTDTSDEDRRLRTMTDA